MAKLRVELVKPEGVVLSQEADFVVAPDVTSFDISEFTRADEMALIGEETTNAIAANLHKMLGKLDSKLFEKSRMRAHAQF